VREDLTERITRLGKMVLRGDVTHWIQELDSVGSARRKELMASYSDEGLIELASLVEEFGGAAVLEAAAQLGARLRRERVGR